MRQKHTLKTAKQYFIEQECQLLEEKYKNCNTPMRYMCKCGNQSKITFSNFRAGHRCRQCGDRKIREKLQLTFEYVEAFFKEQGCELLETEYINSKTKMRYKCSCGGISEIIFNHFKKGHRCDKCGGTKRLTLEYVEQYFLDNDCELLEKIYINNRTEMKYRCSCGNISKATFNKFQNGKRCWKCWIEKITGKNNCNYNHNKTDEERLIERKYLEYYKWRKSTYKKDDYTCQKCLIKGGRLNAHHIEGFASNKDLRTDINNGVTLCESCHKEFHKIYGLKDSDRNQLDEFLKLSNL